jgi:hypothetical protein
MISTEPTALIPVTLLTGFLGSGKHLQAFQLAVWCFPTYLTAILASAAP